MDKYKRPKVGGSKRMKELGFRGVTAYLTEQEYSVASQLAGDKPVSTWAAEKLKKIIKKALTVPGT